MTRRSHAPWLYTGLALLCVLGLSYWLPRPDLSPASRTVPAQLKPAADPGPRVQRQRPRKAKATPQDPALAACEPAAAQRCVKGDVWTVDSCDRLEEKLDECGAQLCRNGRCETADEQPCTEPLEGRCDGDRVRLCYAGRALSIDCASQGLRCAFGDEGAECLPQIPPEERCQGGPRCEGDVLVQCVAGRVQRVDCAAQRASCAQLSDAAFPACLTSLPKPEALARDCGACGCPPDESAPERQCDGHDEDLDGLVDEGLDCGPVPVLAFVVSSQTGQSSHGPDDVQAELERANSLFAKSAQANPLSFVLEDLVWLEDETLLDLDFDEFQRLVSDPRIHPTRDHFYVPLVFTDAISLGGATPKSGVSTLPNGTCGGLQEAQVPEVGLLAVAKGRAITTVAHEIGHFLGLCHTHDQRTGAPRAAAVRSQGHVVDLTACDPSCRDEGDGLCDTPFDPGPEQCRYDALCQTQCLHEDEPDPSNLMGYYTACRQRFSEEQMRLMQHSLALRRAWHPCLQGDCGCELAGDACPTGMSCRPYVAPDGGRTTRCALDGPRGPASDCESTRECGQGTLCIAEQTSGLKRCVRPCLTSTPGCACTALGADLTSALSVCIDDLTAGLR